MSSLSSDSAFPGLTLQDLMPRGLAHQNLALDVELAGAAMACRYSSSDEYEAALIAERRRAGAYDLPKRHRTIVWTGLVAVVCTAFFLAF
jgi:hypothetical protein